MQVISAYLRATYARDFAEAYRYISRPKIVKSAT